MSNCAWRFFSWMETADHSMSDLNGALPAFDGSETGMLDDRTPDTFHGLYDLAVDGAAALGPDVFRAG